MLISVFPVAPVSGNVRTVDRYVESWWIRVLRLCRNNAYNGKVMIVDNQTPSDDLRVRVKTSSPKWFGQDNDQWTARLTLVGGESIHDRERNVISPKIIRT